MHCETPGPCPRGMAQGRLRTRRCTPARSFRLDYRRTVVLRSGNSGFFGRGGLLDLRCPQSLGPLLPRLALLLQLHPTTFLFALASSHSTLPLVLLANGDGCHKYTAPRPCLSRVFSAHRRPLATCLLWRFPLRELHGFRGGFKWRDAFGIPLRSSPLMSRCWDPWMRPLGRDGKKLQVIDGCEESTTVTQEEPV